MALILHQVGRRCGKASRSSACGPKATNSVLNERQRRSFSQSRRELKRSSRFVDNLLPVDQESLRANSNNVFSLTNSFFSCLIWLNLRYSIELWVRDRPVHRSRMSACSICIGPCQRLIRSQRRSRQQALGQLHPATALRLRRGLQGSRCRFASRPSEWRRLFGLSESAGRSHH